MSGHKHTQKPVAAEPRKFGWIAEFSDEHALLVAARKVRDSGYTKTDAFTPFPVHGIDEALGIKPTILPFIVLCCGFCGTMTALVMQYWTNAIDYPYIISGKPMGSWPAFIPVTFELTVLFSAFSTFLGMIALNRLPRFSNPVFNNPKFDRATDDKFFLYVDASDKYYNRQSVQDLLASTTPESLDEVIEDSTPSQIPRFVWMTVVALIIASWIPAVVVLKMRAGKSEEPRFHVFFDMDFQPKKKPQQTTTIFADGRSMRPQVFGTVARGQLEESDPFYLGYDPSKQTAMMELDRPLYVVAQDPPETKRVENPDQGEAPAPGEKPADQPPPVPQPETPKPEEPKPEEPKPEEPKPVVPAPTPEPAKPEEPAKPAESPAANAVAQPAQDPNAAAPTGPNLPFVTEIPTKVDAELMALGEKKYQITCSVCHGLAGDGDGLVHRRADQLAQGYWLNPTSMHDPKVEKMSVGQIFYTITNGKGKMAGYGTALDAKERWAVVAYVRALQKAKNANPGDEKAK